MHHVCSLFFCYAVSLASCLAISICDLGFIPLVLPVLFVLPLASMLALLYHIIYHTTIIYHTLPYYYALSCLGISFELLA